MFSDKLLKKLNDQVNFEFYSSYVYLSMATYAESIDLPGFANFFKVQAQEELYHGMKLYDYIFQKEGVVELESIEKPISEFNGIIDVFQKGYEHEQIVTSRIYELVDIATSEKEYATLNLLRWFVDEQVEEENNFNSLLKKAKRSVDNPASLYLLDDELSTRVFTAPTSNE